MLRFMGVGCILALAGVASAELQTVYVGGELRIRGNWYSPEAGNPLGTAGNVIGTERGNSLSFVEQRTRLNVTANFSKDITAFIELDSYDVWGEDFRSDYITGVDGRAASVDDVAVYQAYIERRNFWGMPLMWRTGRQEIVLGSEFLVGNNDTGSFFRGLSFDGMRLTWEEDTWWVTGFYTILAENSPIEEDGDVTFAGLYGSYTGIEDLVIDAYYLYLRDARGSRLGFPFDTPNAGLFGRVNDHIEDYFGVDQYSDTTTIHTFGVRVAGEYWGFDFEGEFAYQKGEAVNIVKRFFSPDPATSMGTPYGEDDAEFDRYGVNTELGYRFDVQWQPRVYAGWAWFEGEDRREESFGDWLHTFYPFHETDASISFNRLFSDKEYSEFIDNADLSNAHIFRGGLELQPTENVAVELKGAYFLADVAGVTNNVLGVPFFQIESDDELGWEAGISVDYDYSDDLSFGVGYAHFFAGDGLDDNGRILPRLFPKLGGNFVRGNGLLRAGGVDTNDADYVYAETRLRF